MNPYPNDPYNHPNNPYRNPPNPYNNNPAQNFRPNYPVAPFPAQQQLAQQHQRELAPMPANTYGRLQQSLTRIDDREQQYGQRDEERRRFREDTAEARRGAGPNHPAALRLRNLDNRADKTLGKLDRAQRDYNDTAAPFVDSMNANHANMARIVSDNRLPNELVNAITARTDLPPVPLQLPPNATRYRKEEDRRRRRDNYDGY